MAAVLTACAGTDSQPTVAAPTTAEAPSTTTSTAPTTTVPPPTTLPPTTVPPAPLDLRRGATGPEVVALQQELTARGYWLGNADGEYGRLTEQAVMAFQKAEGLPRDGVAGPGTLERLSVSGTPASRITGGHAIEIDLERQILLVVRDGKTVLVFNTS
ncbi:MAG: peptidoglycan-binding domain-containing protein, partial [Nocardioidaceae bacterium]